MIARAMNTRPEEHLAYQDLARHGARVARRLDLNELPRLHALVAGSEGVLVEGVLIDVDLRFHLDDQGSSWVHGTAAVTCELECNRCAETVAFPLRADLELSIQTDPDRASALLPERDVLLVEGAQVSIAEIVEDDLLLALPERLCGGELCERLPSMDYPALVSREAADTSAQQDNPFAVLERLKRPPDGDAQ